MRDPNSESKNEKLSSEGSNQKSDNANVSTDISPDKPVV